MDDTLRGHRASHKAHKLQLRAMLRYGPHRLIRDLENRINRREWAALFAKEKKMTPLPSKYQNSSLYFLWIVRVFNRMPSNIFVHLKCYLLNPWLVDISRFLHSFIHLSVNAEHVLGFFTQKKKICPEKVLIL